MAETEDTRPMESWRGDPMRIPSPPVRETISTTLAELIAARYGLGPTDDEFHLYDYIDPEALDQLFEHTARTDEVEWRLSFAVGDDVVTVHSSGLVVFGD